MLYQIKIDSVLDKQLKHHMKEYGHSNRSEFVRRSIQELMRMERNARANNSRKNP